MSGYIGPSPVPQSIQRRQTFTATAAQTTFGTTGYTDGDFIDVYLNGVKLVGGTDYTATNGTDVVLTTGAAAGDILDFVTFNSFQLNAPSFDNSLTLQNATEEDTDGGRESTIIFKGEQSGGEISTLAEIEASHDGTADDEKGDLIFRTNDGSDGSAPTERLRIDSSGNLLVGKTTIATATAGIALRSNGEVRGTADGDYAARFSRLTSDGAIVGFEKDGTTVGSIGAASGNTYIGSGDTGIGFSAADDTVYPITTATGGIRDAAIDLGGSTYRYKDIYLSGGVYLGGTGAANKLDDYEEGTWTPTVVHGSMTFTNASYIKVGHKVTCWGFLYDFTDRSTVGSLSVGNLPFNPNTSRDEVCVGTMMSQYVDQNNQGVYLSGTGKLEFYSSHSGNFSVLRHSDLNNSLAQVYFTATYYAS